MKEREREIDRERERARFGPLASRFTSWVRWSLGPRVEGFRVQGLV